MLATVPAMAATFEGHARPARPEPQCQINDPDPPTNVRTQPNGVIINKLHNGDTVRIVDQTRSTTGTVGGLWDFVEYGEDALEPGAQGARAGGWVYDPLVRCY